jgi:enamine deaminase RidA (YjgF/YER057c/UK114 family)
MRNTPVLLLSLAFATCTTAREVVPPPDPELPFSRAVVAGGIAYVAGHLGIDPATGRSPADPAVEARLMLDAIAGTLESIGMTMDDFVSVQVYCSDVSLYDTFNAAYRERFTRGFPARAFIGSGPLLRGARFEMLGTARR